MAEPVDSDIYYVDAANGDDNHTGFSPTLAWKTVTKVNAATFTAGDKILFKRGDTYTVALVPPNSGTAARPVTFGAWGSGARPIFLGRSTLSTGGGATWTVYAATAIYSAAHASTAALTTQVWDTNKPLTNVAWDTDIATTAAAMSAGTWSFDDANNLLYVWLYDEVDPDTAGKTMTVTAISTPLSIVAKSYVRCENLHFSFGADMPVYLHANSAIQYGLEFEDCLFQGGLKYSVQFNSTGGSAYTTGATFRRCKIYENNATYTASVAGFACNNSSGFAGIVLIEDCEIVDVDHGILIHGAAALTIRHCHIHDTWDDGIYCTTYSSGLEIYGNVIYHTGDDGINLTNCDGALVFNNTICECSDGGLIVSGTSAASKIYGNIISNNRRAFHATDNAVDVYIQDATTLLDKNVYYSDDGSFIWKWGSTSYTELATWQAASEQDALAVFADPLLVDPEHRCFGVAVNSPAKGLGYVSSISVVDRDYEGRRLTNGYHDAGAVQSVHSGSPASPESQPVLVQSVTGVAGHQVVVTIPADARRTHKLVWLEWSLDGTPTDGRVTVKTGHITRFDIDLTQASDRRGSPDIPGGLYGSIGDSMEIRLDPGAGTVTGKLNYKVY